MEEKNIDEKYQELKGPEVADFFGNITKEDGTLLTPQEQVNFLKELNEALITSPELAKIHFNTQVYNVIQNEVTTRGGHSEGVALTAENLVKALAEREGNIGTPEATASYLLARAFGYMHDLGHTPFGHDGEGALDTEMARFGASEEYKDKRVSLFGLNYTIDAKDYSAEDMCYEHNETSAIIGSKFLMDFARKKGINISEHALQFIKTGILAHSTSRVKSEPVGIEQKAVRLADKIAYIPQDLLDLVKQGVLHVDELTNDELALLGLDTHTFTEKERHDIEAGDTTPEMLIEEKLADIEALRHLDTIDESTRKYLLGTKLNDRVAEVQETLARQCIALDENGNLVLTGKKEIVDQYDKAVNKNEPIKNPETKHGRGVAIFRMMRAAQKNLADEKDFDKYSAFMKGDPDFQFEKTESGDYIMDGKTYSLDQLGEYFQDFTSKVSEDKEKDALRSELAAKIGVNRMSELYKDFLREREGLSPELASLWVTKAKYQDSFINGELAKFSRRAGEPAREDGDGRKTLGDFNDKNENAWKMKATFQYYYSHPENIPEDFKEKYPLDQYTQQHLVGAFIASFTNEGLDTMYSALVAKGLVMSRAGALKAIQDARPDLDIKDLLGIKMEWKVGDNKGDGKEGTVKKYKVSKNDVVEILYRDAIGESIVPGVGLDVIPYGDVEQKKVLEEARIRETKTRTAEDVQSADSKARAALDKAIKVSEEVTMAETVLEMTQRVIDRQNDRQIDPHRQEVAKANGITLENPTVKSDDEGR